MLLDLLAQPGHAIGIPCPLEEVAARVVARAGDVREPALAASVIARSSAMSRTGWQPLPNAK